jgi:hypothetical protein
VKSVVRIWDVDAEYEVERPEGSTSTRITLEVNGMKVSAELERAGADRLGLALAGLDGPPGPLKGKVRPR